MSKVTKKELARKVKELERFVDYADNLLTQLNHALPEPLEIKHWRDEQADHDEVIAILDSKEPKLKQLDQSVFNGLDEKWRFAAVDADGSANGFDIRVYPRGGDEHGLFAYESDYANSDDNSVHIGTGYDATNWQNSLIERESKELTGSDLCRAMLERGDKYVMCLVFDDTRNLDVTYVIRGYHDGYFYTNRTSWENAVPINNQGEPLTASEVGL